MLGVDPTKADDDFKITRFWMEGGKPMFEFNHSADGAGKSFVPKPSLFSLYPLLFTKFKSGRVLCPQPAAARWGQRALPL